MAAMDMRRSTIGVVSTGLILAAVAAAGPLTSQVEKAKYTATYAEGALEVRAYPVMIVAQVATTGDRRTAIGDGFGMIANYIFGDNASHQTVAMTAPVLQQRDGHATDAPVASESGGSWIIRFVMPRQWSLDTLPKPKDARVTLKEEPAATFAVIRFSGFAGSAAIAEKTRELTSFIERQKLHAIGSPVLAFFNPPWTLPFLRRNEIMIAVS